MYKFGFVGVNANDKRLSQYYKSAQSCRDGYHPPVRFVLFYWHAPCKSYHERRRATPSVSAYAEPAPLAGSPNRFCYKSQFTYLTKVHFK